MNDAVDQLAVLLHLARASQLRRRPLVRDRLLVLSGTAALRAKLPEVAHYCRHQILRHNPNHLLGRWPSFQAALEDERFASLLRQLQRRYPLEKAERMLHNLGIERGRERETYFSDLEYAASLLGTTPDEVLELFDGPS